MQSYSVSTTTREDDSLKDLAWLEAFNTSRSSTPTSLQNDNTSMNAHGQSPQTVYEPRRSYNVCPLIDIFTVKPDFYIIYAPVQSEVKPQSIKHRGTPDVRLEFVPKKGTAVTFPYVPSLRDGNGYMLTPTGMCCCPSCVKSVLSRCSHSSLWESELKRVYQLEGFIVPTPFTKSDILFQAWDSAFPQHVIGETGRNACSQPMSTDSLSQN